MAEITIAPLVFVHQEEASDDERDAACTDLENKGDEEGVGSRAGLPVL